jgi:hypothetical protein
MTSLGGGTSCVQTALLLGHSQLSISGFTSPGLRVGELSSFALGTSHSAASVFRVALRYDPASFVFLVGATAQVLSAFLWPELTLRKEGYRWLPFHWRVVLRWRGGHGGELRCSHQKAIDVVSSEKEGRRYFGAPSLFTTYSPRRVRVRSLKSWYSPSFTGCLWTPR